jgi:hypothetical protein
MSLSPAPGLNETAWPCFLQLVLLCTEHASTAHGNFDKSGTAAATWKGKCVALVLTMSRTGHKVSVVAQIPVLGHTRYVSKTYVDVNHLSEVCWGIWECHSYIVIKPLPC